MPPLHHLLHPAPQQRDVVSRGQTLTTPSASEGVGGHRVHSHYPLPPRDPTGELMEKSQPTRWRYHAHEAWERHCSAASSKGDPAPALEDEDIELQQKPCFRRISRWVHDTTGLDEIPEEPLVLYQGLSPWQQQEDCLHYT